jgi:hypothetical protein
MIWKLFQILRAPEGESPGGGGDGAGDGPAAPAPGSQPASDMADAVFNRFNPEVPDADAEDGDRKSEDGDRKPEDDESEDGESEDGESEDGESEDGESEDGESEDGESEEDEESEDDEDAKGSIPRKRFDKVVAQRNEAREKLEAAEAAKAEAERVKADAEKRAQALEAERVVPAPSREDPLSEFTEAESLDRLEENARELRDWLELNPEGGEYRFSGAKEPVEISEDRAKQLRLQVRRDLEQHIPKRREYLKQDRELSGRVAEEAFPALKDKHSEFSGKVHEVIRSFPEIKRLPGHRLAASYYALGMMAFEKHGNRAFDVVVKGAAKPASNGESANGESVNGSSVKKKKAPAKKRGPVPAVAGRPPPRGSGSSSAYEGGKNLGRSDVEGILAERLGL